MIKSFAVSLLAVGMMFVVPGVSSAQVIDIDVQSGFSFDRAIFGQNEHGSSYYSEGYGAANDRNLELLNGTSSRGVAGGLNADSYDWRIRKDAHGAYQIPGGGEARSISTLDYLRQARDHDSLPIITVNQRGLGNGVDGNGEVIYTDTSTNTLKQLAADWVRYTNHIVQTYRQGDTITNTEDQRILNSLSWSGPDYTSDLLLAPGEAAVPKVTYWEIGNEVNFYDTASTYRTKYRDITTAMVAQDSTIKVGPNITGGYQSGSSDANDYLLRLLRSSNWPFGGTNERVDFISYHPYSYQILSVPDTDHAGISQELKDLKANQLAERDWVKARVQTARGTSAANAMPLMATEWNPSTYDNAYRLRQWNALGIVETVMSYAEMGLKAANFWVWPAYIHNGAEIPQYKAFEALTQYGGDTLVESISDTNSRLYVTRDSETGAVTVWGLNFLFGDPSDAAKTFQLSLDDLGIDPGQITFMRLGTVNPNVPTTLISQVDPNSPNNLSIDWTTTDMTGMNLSNFNFTVKPAELALLVIQPIPEPGSITVAIASIAMLSLKRRRSR